MTGVVEDHSGSLPFPISGPIIFLKTNRKLDQKYAIVFFRSVFFNLGSAHSSLGSMRILKWALF